MTLTNTAEQVQIFVLHPDHRTETQPYPRAVLTIGSDPDNDLILDDPEVAEHHARLEPVDGHYRVTDLNSPTGTFLGETRLRPGEPTDWLPEVALRLGESWLSLQAGTEPEVVNPAPARRVGYDLDKVIWNTGQAAGLYLADPQMTLAPGKSGKVTLVLINRQRESELYTLTVTGIPVNWLGALPAVINLGPDSDRQLDLTFQLPRSPATRAGRHRVTVQLIPNHQGDNPVEVTLTLTVLAYSQFTCALNPQSFFINDHAQLTITNLGNLPQAFSLAVEQADEALVVRLPEGSLRLDAGDSTTVEIKVDVPRSLWGNSGRTYPLTLVVEASSGEVQSLQAEVLTLRALPVWLVPGLILSGVGLFIILAFFLVVNWLRFNATPPATPVVLPAMGGEVQDADSDGLANADELKIGTNPNLADSDGDGLNDLDEQRAGTNPLVVDSDGDGLSDGQEVLVLHTSPINVDTDGDSLNDAVDPDPGHLPTPTAELVVVTAQAAQPTATVIVEGAVPPSNLALGGKMAFESQRDGSPQLYLLQLGTNTLLRLTNTSANDEALVESPKRDLFAFVSSRDGNDEIYTMKPDGTSQVRLTNNGARDFDPAWAFDGTRLAFLSDRSGSLEIYVGTVDGAAPTQITSNLSEECCLAWSPSANVLAFMAQEAGNWGLYTIGGDGLNQQRLSPAFAMAPSWSPDGARLAYVSVQDGNSEIYVINRDGSGETRLTATPAQDTNPVWSPDGAHLAFISDRDGLPQVYVMNADGSAPTRLMPSPGRQCCLVWSPDGSRLLFASDQNGNDEIFLAGLGGGGALQLTNNPGPDLPAAWLP